MLFKETYRFLPTDFPLWVVYIAAKKEEVLRQILSEELVCESVQQFPDGVRSEIYLVQAETGEIAQEMALGQFRTDYGVDAPGDDEKSEWFLEILAQELTRKEGEPVLPTLLLVPTSQLPPFFPSNINQEDLN